MIWPFSRRREPEFIGSDAPDAWSLGRFLDERTGRVGPELRLGGTELIVIVGRNRSGKDAGIGMVNGLRMEGSLVVGRSARRGFRRLRALPPLSYANVLLKSARRSDGHSWL